jgi:hypothetical protein
MSPSLIEFHANGLEHFPAPYPASRDIPDWYKQMPVDAADGPGKTVPTLKRCLPLLDAMSAGYLIPLANDLHLKTDAGGSLEYSSGQIELMSSHSVNQYRRTPFERAIVVKFMSPWVVRTPPGYSTLVVQPMNRFHFPFPILSGLVDTDGHYQRLHYPAVCLMPPGQSLTLPRGTAIAQLIPFRREDWVSRSSVPDKALLDAQYAAVDANAHLYRDEHWNKKTWG